MISNIERSAGILTRFANKDPLNLSAVNVEAPWLLDGLFDPENFRGWRETIELAGVSIGDIRIEPLTEVTCEECGFIGDTLWSHLQHAHGMSAEEYRGAHPAAETSSEAHRAQMMSNRHGRPAKLLIPHWEPAWSRNYALDRIHEFSRQGIPLYYSYVAKNEPGFPAYVRRVFQSWDAGLAAAGIEVAKVRRAREAIDIGADEVVAVLREKQQEKPSQLHIRASRAGGGKTVITAAFRHFGSHAQALKAASVQRLPHSYDQRDYATGDEVIETIRRRHRNGESLYYSDLERRNGQRTLLKWSARFFGSFAGALAAAGVPHPGVKPADRRRRPEEPTARPSRH